jgi:hypothetical protein
MGKLERESRAPRGVGRLFRSRRTNWVSQRRDIAVNGVSSGVPLEAMIQRFSSVVRNRYEKKKRGGTREGRRGERRKYGGGVVESSHGPCNHEPTFIFQDILCFNSFMCVFIVIFIIFTFVCVA